MVSVEERYEHLEKTIRGYNISADLTQIRAAYEYAREHHGEQMRRDGSPYITHPIHVSSMQSWSRAAMMDSLSRRISATICATWSGWVI